MTQKKGNPPLVKYPVIVEAIAGDPIAIQSVLHHYRKYISTLSTYGYNDDFGNTHVTVDRDVYDEVEIALITGILDFELAV